MVAKIRNPKKIKDFLLLTLKIVITITILNPICFMIYGGIVQIQAITNNYGEEPPSSLYRPKNYRYFDKELVYCWVMGISVDEIPYAGVEVKIRVGVYYYPEFCPGELIYFTKIDTDSKYIKIDLWEIEDHSFCFCAMGVFYRYIKITFPIGHTTWLLEINYCKKKVNVI